MSALINQAENDYSITTIHHVSVQKQTTKPLPETTDNITSLPSPIPAYQKSRRTEAWIRELERSDYAFVQEAAKRLFYLVFSEDKLNDEDWPDMNLGSLSSFVVFFSKVNFYKRFTKKPKLFLTSAGNIRAEFGDSQSRFLGMEFLPRNRVKYVFFSLSDENPKEPNRQSGVTSFASLLELVKEAMWL